MKKIFLIIFILSYITFSYAQETEGEATKKRIKRIFDKEYKQEKFNLYSGNISSKLSSDQLIVSYDSMMISMSKKSFKYKDIFEKGLLYPNLLGGSKKYPLSICCIEELTYVKSSPKYRRYSIWVFMNGLMNPNLFIFELKNENANKNESTEDFIKDAHMTFFKYGWTII